MPSGGPIEFVLFDLGGVLVDPGGVAHMRELSGIASDEELWARWLGCRWVRRFEAGQCGPEAFAAGVVEDWGLALEPAAFLAAFSGWTVDPYPGAPELVREVGALARVGCLSNTNQVQWEVYGRGRSTALFDSFEVCFLSFELGLVKPDPAIFDVVASRLPAAPGRVLFLDDNAVNVHAAEARGFAARHVRGPDAARAALEEAGVLV